MAFLRNDDVVPAVQVDGRAADELRLAVRAVAERGHVARPFRDVPGRRLPDGVGDDGDSLL